MDTNTAQKERTKAWWDVVARHMPNIATGLIFLLAASLLWFSLSKQWPEQWNHIIGAVLVACVVRLFESAFHKVSCLQRHRRLRKFLGIENATIDAYIPVYNNSIASETIRLNISCSWPEISPESSEAPPEFSIFSTKKVKGKRANRTLAVFEDVEAASNLLSLACEGTEVGGFRRNDMRIHSHDDHSLEFVQGAGRKVAFCVGLLSNALTKLVYDFTRRSAPSISSMFAVEFTDEETATTATIRLREGSNNWKEWTARSQLRFPPESKVKEYALLAKIVSDDENRIAFICGGISARGTHRASQFFKDNWDKIWNWNPGGEYSRPVQARPFAVVLEISENDIVSIVSACAPVHTNGSEPRVSFSLHGAEPTGTRREGLLPN